MKKYAYIILALLTLSGCSDEENTATQNQQETNIATQELNYEDKVFAFKASDLQTGCQDDSQMICAINLAVKCTLNPKFSECDKSKMPRFIFMEDESLDRPNELSYQIKKIRPLQDSTVEVITQSQCNGNWFGLCNGTIIYVMNLQDNSWKVKDLYALQEF